MCAEHEAGDDGNGHDHIDYEVTRIPQENYNVCLFTHYVSV